MTPAPDGLCMVGQELYIRQAEYWNNAGANRHKTLGWQWESAAKDMHNALLKHSSICKICKRTIAQ